MSSFRLLCLSSRMPYRRQLVSEEPLGSPEFKNASLHTCHALKTPPDRPGLTKPTLSCWLQHTLQPGHPGPTSYKSWRMHTFGAVPSFREVRPPLWLTWFSVYASDLSSGSYVDLLSHRSRIRNTRYGQLVRPYPIGTFTLYRSASLCSARNAWAERPRVAQRPVVLLQPMVGRSRAPAARKHSLSS